MLDIRAAHKLGRCTYGSPRVHAELRAKGMHVSEKRIARPDVLGLDANRREGFCILRFQWRDTEWARPQVAARRNRLNRAGF